MAEDKIYIAIDLKSFYASVECVERGLDPLTTNLVVADLSRTEKTICLAVSPSLKSLGISGRARLFEVVEQVSVANGQRRSMCPDRRFSGESYDADALKADPSLAIGYITAPPRMALYMDYSTRIYSVYLKYIEPRDIHIYSIDEVFIDATFYVKASGLTAHEFARVLIRDVLEATGITATAGIGTNMYLCKVAMDIVAKHIPADEDGVRIAELDEMTYRQKLWSHRPITDFWRVGRGIADKLASHGMLTMGDIARCSVGSENEYHNEGLLYKLFGVNAELLIDHAWGWEPCTIAQVKAYKPKANSISTGQVLHTPYDFHGARLILKEMSDLLALDLVEKGLVTDQLVLTVGYDIENLKDQRIIGKYRGDIVTDHYGRRIPKHAHGTANLKEHTSSSNLITAALTELFDRIVDPRLLIRRITLAACRIEDEGFVLSEDTGIQLDLFTDHEEFRRKREQEKAMLARERKMQLALLDIKKKYGKNAILKGINFEEGATAKDRNSQIGGHKA